MYQQTFSRDTPGCIVIVLDRSASMENDWGASGLTLAHGAARAINKILLELCVKSTKKQGEMRHYFDVGLFGYGLCGSGAEGVESALPGALADRGIVPLPEVARHPLAVQEEPALDRGAPPSKVPVWVEPTAGHLTPMCEAFAVVGKHVYDWVRAHPRSFPPVIINITDGLVTDDGYGGASLEEWAQRLRTIRTADGTALVMNIFLSPAQGAERWFPANPDGLPDPGPQLFAISTPMPDQMLRNARAAQIDVGPGSRGFVFGASLEMLVKFLEIGTRFDVRDR
jgi:hypothetical protein